jgi:hypothetical protein
MPYGYVAAMPCTCNDCYSSPITWLGHQKCIQEGKEFIFTRSLLKTKVDIRGRLALAANMKLDLPSRVLWHLGGTGGIQLDLGPFHLHPKAIYHHRNSFAERDQL